ncbi:RNA polymerase factor sigma-54 [Membranicola marinus]|uniref:RNA polymerase factor sigma-54 n=1 Tax=Membranihabitans marinus TaxID=1227546 RepID=A0A953HW71_9BACT|nr:RNA polymerase factor sigma-54 [Membranihabitans marinus]MBY5959365.1 RNA polymerase factor sigma-54 [Membranihabitans marinus]
MLKQSLTQKMSQKLSPQQIQLMKLLQIPTLALEQRIKEELESNPALEEGVTTIEEKEFEDQDYDQKSEESEGDFEVDEYLKEFAEDDPTIYRNYSRSGDDEDEFKKPIEVVNSYHDHLERQLGMLSFESPEDYTIALQILGSIDGDGYLRRDPSAVVDDLMFTQNMITSEDNVLRVLKRIQQFDPPGTGARNLQECLELQLSQKLRREKDNPDLDLAYVIVSKHFDKFSKKHFSKLLTSLDISEEELKDAFDEILKLNPKPASGYAPERKRDSMYIIPDFIIENNNGELELSLNSRNAPDLRISDQYRAMLKSYKTRKKQGSIKSKDREAALFIKQKLDSAKWFIDAISKRRDTMYRTMYAILQFQYDFFLSNDQRTLKPMILKDIAEMTGLDVSTISRVANSKYVQTEYGTKKLRDFFSESIQNSEGEEVSTLEVKKILSDIIDAENKRKPLSDEKLRKALIEKGYKIARRTIAKYRDQLSIPVARLRKEL